MVQQAAGEGAPAAERLKALASAWIDAYENTMLGLHDIPSDKASRYCGQGAEPEFLWVAARDGRRSIHPKTSCTARSWHQIGDRIAEFGWLGSCTGSGPKLHRHALSVKLRRWRPSELPQDQRLLSREGDAELEHDALTLAKRLRGWARRCSVATATQAEGLVAADKAVACSYDQRFWAFKQRQWHQWAQRACIYGDGAAHRWTKPPIGTVLPKDAGGASGPVGGRAGRLARGVVLSGGSTGLDGHASRCAIATPQSR